MSKTDVFLSEYNQQKLIKIIFQKHRNDGGSFPLATFQEQIPELMNKWNKLAILDSYESLIFDPISEMESINNEFVHTYWPMFSVGDDYKSVKKLSTPADYHNLDTAAPADITVSNNVYRFNNTIPLYQRLPDRHYDRDDAGSGLQGRETQQDAPSCGPMDALLAHTNVPYKTIDTDDVPYYGQLPDDDTTSLTTTVWKST